MASDWDCIVVGAGAAGLSAALVLGRARRRTLVVDAGGQSNRPSEGIGGLLGQDGKPPEAFYAFGRGELGKYPSVELREGSVTTARREGDGFVVELADGARETTRRVLLATGVDYRFPDVDGVTERWGRSAFHCPFCHGWEHRDEPLGVLQAGAAGVHRALMLRTWSDDVTLLTNGPSELEPEDVRRLAGAGVRVDERPIARLEGPGSTVTAVVFADGDRHPCSGVLVPVTLHQRSVLAEQLGATLAEPGPVAADAVEVDAGFRTSVAGLYAAGDATTQMPSVASAIATGHTAASMVVGDAIADRASE